MRCLASAALALALAAAPVPFQERVEGERAVERARYAFVLNATTPFDQAYPRSVFERRARREADEERVLASAFGFAITEPMLAAEYARIERDTRDPEQWRAMKRALGGDRRRVEAIVCRPLVVDRTLRARFAFDPAIHAPELRAARAARAAFLAGRTPDGAVRLRLARGGSLRDTTQQMLARARAAASEPTRAAPRPAPGAAEPLPVPPEMAAVLQEQLRAKGDVTTILEELTRFSVYRLVAASPSEWTVDAVQVRKAGFDEWFERTRREGYQSRMTSARHHGG